MIYFASDIHLGSGSAEHAREVESRFVAWLQQIATDAEAVFLVGDIFDYWFEYRKVVPKGFVRVLGQIASMTDRGIRVVMLTGNHDMWLTDYLSTECGMEVYTAPQCFNLANRNLFIAHGDNMNIKGQPMLRLMNRIFRSGVLRSLFSWLIHPDLAVNFGQKWSSSSRKSHMMSSVLSKEDIDLLTSSLREYADQRVPDNADCVIFGHLHVEAEYHNKRDIYFLGNWSEHNNYLRMSADGTIEYLHN